MTCIKTNSMVAALSAFCLTAALFMIVPIESKVGYYDPWIDINDDGKIDMRDVAMVARGYGSLGEPISKASLSYDSGWVDITNKAGGYFNITHGLNSTDIVVDITGKTTVDGGVHQRYLGLTGYMLGWNRTYGGPNDERAYSLIQTRDGGYAMAGVTDFFGDNPDFWLVKTDEYGNVQWSETYGSADLSESAYSVIQTNDGGYAIAGYTGFEDVGQAWLIKTDPTGNMEWSLRYGGPGFFTSAYCVLQTIDGGYAVAAITSTIHWSSTVLLKLDASGSLVWEQRYSRKQFNELRCVIQTGDGGYALAGTTGYSFGEFEFWLVKADSQGIAAWNETYGWGRGYSVVQTPDGGYAMTGGFEVESDAANLVKISASGNLQWRKYYGGWMHSLVQTMDHGYCMAGYTHYYTYGLAQDVWLVKTDWAGNCLWTRTYGGSGLERARSVVQTNDGGYAVAGYTLSDFWLIKTDADGNMEGPELGLAWTDSTLYNITLYRGATDPYWNFVRVRVWKVKENP